MSDPPEQSALTEAAIETMNQLRSEPLVPIEEGSMPIPRKEPMSEISDERAAACTEASRFQCDAHTIGRDDQWLTLVVRMLLHMEREDVAAGLERELDIAQSALLAAREREQGLSWVAKVPTECGMYLRSNMGKVTFCHVYRMPGVEPPNDLCVSGDSISGIRLHGPARWVGAEKMLWYGPIPEAPALTGDKP